MHIAQVSRVFRKTPSEWIRLLREMEESRDNLPKPYSALRQALVDTIRGLTGNPRSRLVNSLNRMPDSTQTATIRQKSLAGYDYFAGQVLPQITGLEEDFIRGEAPQPVNFEGFELKGRFHCKVRCKNGDAYLFLHCSDWDNDRKLAYLELLSVIAEVRHKSDRQSVWFVDLPAQRITRPSKSFLKLRRELRSTMDLFQRVAASPDTQAAIDFDW